jgi:hypothetical protein
MSNALALCTGCSRHVHAEETRCPFCDASLESRGGVAWGRVGVGVLLALAAGATLNACYGAPCANSASARCDYEPDAQTDAPSDGATADR